MADYAIVNLLEHRRRRPGTRRGAGGPPNLRPRGAHSHREQEEAYVVVAGEGGDGQRSDAPWPDET